MILKTNLANLAIGHGGSNAAHEKDIMFHCLLQLDTTKTKATSTTMFFNTCLFRFGHEIHLDGQFLHFSHPH